jgi:hypothetical protein
LERAKRRRRRQQQPSDMKDSRRVRVCAYVCACACACVCSYSHRATFFTCVQQGTNEQLRSACRACTYGHTHTHTPEVRPRAGTPVNRDAVEATEPLSNRFRMTSLCSAALDETVKLSNLSVCARPNATTVTHTLTAANMIRSRASPKTHTMYSTHVSCVNGQSHSTPAPAFEAARTE